MSKRSDSPQQEQQHSQETSQSHSSQSPHSSAANSTSSQGSNNNNKKRSHHHHHHHQQQPQQAPLSQAELEKQRQENLKQFDILMAPAFAAFSQILDGLFLTGVGGMSVDNFRKNKITHIINCTHEAPNWRLSGVECHRIPMDDVSTEDLLSHLDSTVDRINAILADGGRVVVHCVAGVSRSAAIVMAFLIKHKKMTLREAYNHVQSCRRVVRPNNGFFNQLIVFETKIMGTPSVKMVKLKRDDVYIEIPDFFESEHTKFVLMETLKVKAANINAMVQGNSHSSKGHKTLSQPAPKTPSHTTAQTSTAASNTAPAITLLNASVAPSAQPTILSPLRMHSPNRQPVRVSSNSSQVTSNQSPKPSSHSSRSMKSSSRSPSQSPSRQSQIRSQSQLNTRPPSQ